jgi:hypothetical protein
VLTKGMMCRKLFCIYRVHCLLLANSNDGCLEDYETHMYMFELLQYLLPASLVVRSR